MRLILLLCALFSIPALADSTVQNEHTRATLIPAYDSFMPDGETTVGVLLEPTPGWHTYWENPGDAGIATTLTWELPEGVHVGPILWPVPTRILEGPLAIYGYEGNVLLPVNIHIPKSFSEHRLPVKVKAEWLVCDNICVPESAELSLEITLADNEVTPTGDYGMFLRAEDTRPVKIAAPLSYHLTRDAFEITLPEPIPADGSVYFFPREQNQIAYAKPQQVKDRVLRVPRNENAEVEDTLSGYLTAGDKAYEITASKQSESTTPNENNAPSPYSFIGLLLFAIIGGLILNLMPCVLPILSLKAIAIAKKSGHDRHIIVRQALAYTLGVLVSFAAIAALLISLQMAGLSIGWGFQMQYPPFVGFLAVLLFLVALNLAGMFDLPVLMGNALNDTPTHSLRGSFLTGVLAVAVATPCTAPFMAIAVGATLTLSPALALMIFLGIGLGLSLPFLLIALFPKLVGFLPKPGAWMETFKQLMAFPMFASVIWLLWVLTQQTGAHGLLAVLITMLVMSFLIWLKGRCKDPSPFCKIAVLLLLLATLANGLAALSNLQANVQKNEVVPFSEAKLSELRASGTPVLVDATAAWCLTCQVNEHTAIHTSRSRAAFEETGTQLLVADWTNRNPEITAFLKRFGYNGVPLYVYFPADGEPVVLPQLLSESIIISTLKGQPQ